MISIIAGDCARHQAFTQGLHDRHSWMAGAETHVLGIGITREGKRVVTVQPAVVGMATFVRADETWMKWLRYPELSRRKWSFAHARAAVEAIDCYLSGGCRFGGARGGRRGFRSGRGCLDAGGFGGLSGSVPPVRRTPLSSRPALRACDSLGNRFSASAPCPQLPGCWLARPGRFAPGWRKHLCHLGSCGFAFSSERSTRTEILGALPGRNLRL